MTAMPIHGNDRRTTLTYAGIACAFLVIVGSLAPWWSDRSGVQKLTLDGIEVPPFNGDLTTQSPFLLANDTVMLPEGVATLMLAQFAITLCLLGLLGPERARGRLVGAAAVCFALAALIGFVDCLSIANDNASSGTNLEWGIFLVAFVALAGLAATAFASAQGALALTRGGAGDRGTRPVLAAPARPPGPLRLDAPSPPPPAAAPRAPTTPPPASLRATAAQRPGDIAVAPDLPPPPAVPDRGLLTVDAGGEIGGIHVLGPGESIIVGTDARPGVRIADPAASARHVEVRLQDGHWEVRDLGSVRPAQLRLPDGMVAAIGITPARADEGEVLIGAAVVRLHHPEVSAEAG